MSFPLQASAKCKFCLFNLFFFCYVTIIDKSWQNVCTQKHISLVSVWSAESHVKTFYSGVRSRGNWMKWGYAGFVDNSLCSKLACSFFWTEAWTLFQLFNIWRDTKRAVTSHNYNCPWIGRCTRIIGGGPGRFQLSPQTVVMQTPKSCFAHVSACKHRLKASSLQIGDSSHRAECQFTKTKSLEEIAAIYKKWRFVHVVQWKSNEAFGVGYFSFFFFPATNKVKSNFVNGFLETPVKK